MRKPIALTVALITTSVLSVGSLSSTQQTESEISGEDLCKEVQVELDISVEDGILTQKDADAIVGRCYRYYANVRG